MKTQTLTLTLTMAGALALAAPLAAQSPDQAAQNAERRGPGRARGAGRADHRELGDCRAVDVARTVTSRAPWTSRGWRDVARSVDVDARPRPRAGRAAGRRPWRVAGDWDQRAIATARRCAPSARKRTRSARRSACSATATARTPTTTRDRARSTPRRWDRAVSAFDRVIEVKGAKSDAALYWKAYAQNKQGQRPEALATINIAGQGLPEEPLSERRQGPRSRSEAELRSARRTRPPRATRS